MANKYLPYFKFESPEWNNGNIQICSLQAKGLFIDICAMYWTRIGEVSYALALQKLCNGNSEVITELLDSQIIALDDDQNLIIEFLDEQLSEFRDVSEKRRKAADKRWNNAREMQMHSKSNAIKTRQDQTRPDKTRQEEKENKLLLFQTFWDKYEKKVGREKVIEKWQKLSFEEINECLDRVSDYVKSKPDKQFRKDPLTFLNGKHWRDEIILPLKNQNNGTTEERKSLSDRANEYFAKNNFGSSENDGSRQSDNFEDVNHEVVE